MADLLEVALTGARAGAAVLAGSPVAPGAPREKSSVVDLVTATDIASGAAVVSAILAVLPSARFVVEEPEVYGIAGIEPAQLSDDEVWVIDPLDGTTSYVHGYPCYSVSVGLLREGRPEVGVVLNVPGGEVFAARRGEGATRNGDPVRVSTVSAIERALLVTGFPYDRGATIERQFRIFTDLVRDANDVRRDGSAAIDCCHVACGRCDAFWELALRPWDLAAGVLIAEEAGAVVTGVDGVPWTPSTTDVLIAGPSLHQLMLQRIAAVERRDA